MTDLIQIVNRDLRDALGLRYPINNLRETRVLSQICQRTPTANR